MAIDDTLLELFMGKKPAIERIINPFGCFPQPSYPLDHVGHFSRFPKAYRWVMPAKDLASISPDYASLSGNVGWIDAAQLKAATAIYHGGSFNRMPIEEFKAMADIALDEIANQCYMAEWKSAAELGFIDRIIAEQPAARVANREFLTRITPYMIDRLKSGSFVLMDLGVGNGGSSVAIVDSIPQEMRRDITLLAVDVMPDAVNASRALFEQKGVGNVVPVVTLAAKMHESDVLAGYMGKVDGFVSGACIHQNTDFDSIFGTIKGLMSPGGTVWIWDWIHTAWIHPYLKTGYNIPDQNPPGISGRGIDGVREMLKVWVGLHGWGVTEQEKSEGQTLGLYQRKLLDDFNFSVTRNGFIFNSWLDANLCGKTPPNGRSPYFSAEAHCDPFIYRNLLGTHFGNYAVEQIKGTPLLFGFHSVKRA